MSNCDQNFRQLIELIKPNRLRGSTRGGVSLLQETESDKGRVLNSPSFRRLQQKTQVFPLEPNAAVRTRLTHTIEVSQIGRFLTQQVIEKCANKNFSYEELASFANIVEAACLLHDIGNPPFGHLGESAIKEWATVNNQCADLREFDGNPQGFRLMSYLQGEDGFGLNLTSSLLLSTVKYPWCVDSRDKSAKSKKIGVFNSDWHTYSAAAQQVSWQVGKKFPFAQLMEAADDIAYSMSDLEDGVEKGVIRLEDIQEVFDGPWDKNGAVDPFVAFKTNTIREAVAEAAIVFVDNLGRILDGKTVELVDSSNPKGEVISKVKIFALDKIYSHSSAEILEISGRNIIASLLGQYENLLTLDAESFEILVSDDKKEARKKNLDYQIRLFRRLPRKYKRRYKDEKRGSEEERRAHLFVDFLAGMTDDYALEMHQVFGGIKIK